MRNLKKVAFIFTISTIILSVFNLSNAATGVVNTPAVRIRKKASTDSEILTKGYEGEELEILGEEGDWYKVKINGKTGYASKSLIKEKEVKENQENETNSKDNASKDNNVVVENTATNSNTVSTYETEKENSVKNETTENNSSPENTPTTDTNKKIIIKEDCSLKLLPNFSSNNIKLLTKGEEVKINKELNNWSEITIEGTTGWVIKNKIGESTDENSPEKEPEKQPEKQPEAKPEEKPEEDKLTTQTSEARNSKGIVNVETANVRAKADKKSSIIAHLDEGDEVTIVEEIGDWYKITNSEVSSGYVAKQLITLSDITSRSTVESRKENVKEQVVTKTDTTSEIVSNLSKGSEVVQFAKQYLGTSYVLGGKTPDSGFDCSGYTRYVFKNFGYSLGTVAASQDTVGIEVSREELKEGDLILFLNEGKTKIGHTGIYIGGDQFIHAANPERGVVIDGFSTNSYYSSRFVTARRIVE